MDRYYFITSDFSRVGVPMFLEGGLYEDFIEKNTYIKNYTFPPLDMMITPKWRKKITLDDPIQMPEKLYLINKHRKIDFDLYYKDEGFIVSNDLKNIIDSCNHPQFVSSHLEVRTREGVCNTNKEYWYIKILEQSPCIDFEKSEVKLLNKNSKEQQPRVDKYLDKVYFNSSFFIRKELFWINNSYIDNYLYCNQETYKTLIDAKIKTIKIFEIESLFDHLFEITKRKTKLFIE